MTSIEALRAKSTSQILCTVHECQACATRVDVSRFRPGQKLLCPECGTEFFVKGLEEEEDVLPAPCPRVVRGPTKVVRKARPWVKIGVVAAVVVGLGVGILWSRGKKKTVAGPSSETPEQAERALPVSAAAPLVASRSGVTPGMYVVRSVKSEQLLEVHKYETSSNAKILAEPGQAGGAVAGNQRWIFRLLGPNTWEIVSFHSLKALELESNDDAARIGQGKLTGHSAQLWSLERTGDGFKILSQGSGKALTLIGDTPKGTQVGQRAPASGPEQLWRLENVGPLPSDAGLLFAGPGSKVQPPVVAVQGAAPSGGRFVSIPFEKVANGDSREGLFRDPKATKESVHPTITGWIRAGELPFNVLPTSGKNVVVLVGGQVAKKNPTRVEIPMGGVALTKLHFLGGVAAWGYPSGGPVDDRYGSVIAKVIVVRKSGEESIVLRNGVEIADYLDAAEVSGSSKVIGLVAHGRQVRTFSKTLGSTEPVEKIVLQGYAGHAAPVFLAMTGETK